jgi:NADH:ubiquinone oxidoreductase subunit 6 (subunit J)
MNVNTILFYGFEVLAALSAITLLFIRNVFYGTLLLIVCLLSIAGVYIFLNAEFIAVTQILIYAGGILVLIIFGVMLTSKFSGKPLVVENKHWLPGIVVGFFFFALLSKLFSETHFYSNDQLQQESTFTPINKIGVLLMSDYVLPFEVAGLLLLVALISAAVIASSFNSIKKQ